MNWQRIIAGSMTFTFGFILNNSISFAQNPRALSGPSDEWRQMMDASTQASTPNSVPIGSLPGDGPFNSAGQIGMTPHTEMEREAAELSTAQTVPYAPNVNQQAPKLPAGQDAVSVHQLLHPLSKQGQKLLRKVSAYLKNGQRDKAKSELAKAMKEPSAEPYAHAMLGTEYLREGQPLAAVPELETAARVLPIAGVHSNLGYALCLTGDNKRGQQELEEALRLDGTSSKARFLLGVVLLNQKARADEAEYDLNLAQGKVQAAHLALAVCQIRRGDTASAQEQVRQFLGDNRKNEFPIAWQWASAAAARIDPAAAFGFHGGTVK